MNKDSYVFFDFDNTLYKGQSRYLILDITNYLFKRGSFNSIEFENINNLFSSYFQGIINRHDFGVRVVESYYRGLTGLYEKEILDITRDFWDRFQANSWFSYTIPLLKMINNSTIKILVSGSPVEVLEMIKKPLGFKEIYASKGTIKNGIYTGFTTKEMATSSAKSKLMLDLSHTIAFNPAKSFAFGDSESDFPLLEAVTPDNAYLFGASESLKRQVADRNWNLLDQEKEILDHVNSRINTLFPE